MRDLSLLSLPSATSLSLSLFLVVILRLVKADTDGRHKRQINTNSYRNEILEQSGACHCLIRPKCLISLTT